LPSVITQNETINKVLAHHLGTVETSLFNLIPAVFTAISNSSDDYKLKLFARGQSESGVR